MTIWAGDVGVHARAPGKVNLFMRVGALDADGYHDVATAYQAVSLYEDVRAWHDDEFSVAFGGSIDTSGLPTDASNLAIRAAKLLARHTGVPGGVRLEIEKHVPIAGGMGGGSADAAATLVACDALWGTGLPKEELHALAAKLGADVPFALTGGICLGSGRGERLRRLPALPGAPAFVVVAPQVPVATAWAYQAWDADPLTGGRGSASMLESAIRHESLSRIADALSNDLEAVVERRYGVVRKIREDLDALGVLGARMSGSGSAVFGLVGGRGDALHVAAALRSFEHPVIVCRPLPAGCRPSNA